MVNDQTQQFLYRAVIVTVCLLTGSIFIFLFVMAARFGDGEAVNIIDAMQPVALGCLGAMVTTVLGSHAAGAYTAKQMATMHIAQLQATAGAGETLAGVAGLATAAHG